MAGRIRLGRRGGRVLVVLATTVYVTGLAIAAAPQGNAIGGSCNGHLATSPTLDASHERGPVILMGTPNDDVIIGSRGDDTIKGGLGDDYICGGGGADNISGGPDTLTAGQHDDDVIFGESGDDTLSGGAGDDFISGGWGNDDIDGGDGVNLLYGDGGDDVLDSTESVGGSKSDGGPGRNLCLVGMGTETRNCHY